MVNSLSLVDRCKIKALRMNDNWECWLTKAVIVGGMGFVGR